MDFLLIFSTTSDSLLTGSNIYTHHKTPSAEAYRGRSNWTGKKTMFNHFSFLPHKQVSQLSLVTQSTSQTPSGTQWHHLNYINSHVKCCRFRSLSHCSVANLQRFCCFRCSFWCIFGLPAPVKKSTCDSKTQFASAKVASKSQWKLHDFGVAQV